MSAVEALYSKVSNQIDVHMMIFIGVLVQFGLKIQRIDRFGPSWYGPDLGLK